MDQFEDKAKNSVSWVKNILFLDAIESKVSCTPIFQKDFCLNYDLKLFKFQVIHAKCVHIDINST